MKYICNHLHNYCNLPFLCRNIFGLNLQLEIFATSINPQWKNFPYGYFDSLTFYMCPALPLVMYSLEYVIYSIYRARARVEGWV